MYSINREYYCWSVQQAKSCIGNEYL